jgi:Tol biopolymer transport system component
LAVGVTRPANGDIFLIDSTSGDARQFTFGEAFDFSPVWSPASDRVAYVSEDVRSTIEVEKVSERGGSESLYTGQEDSDLWVRSWSPDGQWLLFVEAPEGQGDIYALNVEDGKTIPIVVTPAAEEYPQFSPDGKWIAYQSDNAGRTEVYVVAFPEVGRPEPISSQGGDHPRWAPTGDELFFWNNQTLMSSRVVLSETFSREPAKRLFDIPEVQAGSMYAVAPEGNKFLVALKNPDWPASEIIVIENWFSELKRLVPTDN